METTLQSIGTVLVFVAFMALFWWVFIAHKKSDFDEAANLPFADDGRSDTKSDIKNDEQQDAQQDRGEKQQ